MFLRRKREVPVESEKFNVLKALFGHLNRSLRERNTGFAQVLVNLVVVFLRREKLSFLQNRAVNDFINPDEDEDSGFSRRIHRREKLSFFAESCSDPFY